MPDRSGGEGRIILVRHGETEANRRGCFADSDNIPLTDTGRGQAAALASSIHTQFKPARIFSSEFLRARQTADIIARRFGIQAETLAGIHERNFGVLKGQPYRQMGTAMLADPEYNAVKRWLWKPPEGESLESVRLRVVTALQGLQSRFSDQDVVVVSHGAVMESIAAHLAQDWENAAVPQNCATLVLEYRQLFR